LPELRSGKINTFASPFILPFGFFSLLHPEQMLRRIAALRHTLTWGLLFVSSNARITLSSDSSFALPFVEKDKNAAFGMLPVIFMIYRGLYCNIRKLLSSWYRQYPRNQRKIKLYFQENGPLEM
jgi:hypothetical protein